ncbi:intradiol ring-cleavage dioxygenase [Flagellimonas okinawensis]|uniref:Intradiol ring-cleavage dioxygenase n=1 Tax=Flagellimonas okinawensis TaxID=3031324 RepID=A0ABT5XTG6_9FLAO|nr:intradiol ring-cleavage dioxygenase [[Muricauda] okinawensis]MDF0709077.1 intradiol ring-cleavage dioxygenase [[Muricauda] okinawensis]
MERKEFIKGLGLAGLSITGLTFIGACSKDETIAIDDLENTDADSSTNTDTTTDTTTDTNTSGDCEITPSETEGPFPTKDPAEYVRVDIVGDRTGIPLDLDIKIRNVNDECNALEGAIVDIWHCDKDGNYSEYGGSGMQQTNYTSNHFLRGRQTSDTDGLVEFATIFPGWYSGRSTHIHVHIYNESGESLLVTQIAFPEGENSAVVRVNAANDEGYTKGMSGYTYHAQDNVFGDGVEEELASVSGSNTEGYVLTHDIYVSA